MVVNLNLGASYLLDCPVVFYVNASTVFPSVSQFLLIEEPQLYWIRKHLKSWYHLYLLKDFNLSFYLFFKLVNLFIY